MVQITDMQAGKAGEYLVCYDLILKGLIAYPSEQGLPYDVVVDCHGGLLKIQVKTARKPNAHPQHKCKAPTCRFIIKRTTYRKDRRGLGGKLPYSNHDFDILALVNLEHSEIAYIPFSQIKSGVNLRSAKYRGTYHDELLKDRSAQFVELRKAGKSLKEVCEMTGLSEGSVSVLWRSRSFSRKFGSPYFCDKKWDDALAVVIADAR